LDQHPGNLPGIRASFTRALKPTATINHDAHCEDDDDRGALLPGADLQPQTSPDSGGEEAERQAAALRVELHRYSRMLLLTLALEVDRLEQLIRKHHPEYHYIDLEVL